MAVHFELGVDHQEVLWEVQGNVNIKDKNENKGQLVITVRTRPEVDSILIR